MKTSAACLFALVMASPFLFGQDSPPVAPTPREATVPRSEAAESPEKVEESLVVTTTRGERRLDDLPVSATVIDRKQIGVTPALTTNDLVRQVPGLNLPLLDAAFQHPTSDFLSIRGLGGPRVLVLLDGIPINDPFFGFVQWEKAPMSFLDRVEVVRGGASALFGTYALGGVVNLLTHPARETNLTAQVQHGTLRTTRASVAGGWHASDRLSVTGNVEYFDTAGYVEIAPEERSASDIRTGGSSANGQLKLDYQASSSVRLFLRSNLFSNSQDLQTLHSRNDRHVLDVAGGGQWRLGLESEVSGNVFYGRDRFRTDNTDYIDPAAHGTDYVSNIHETPARDIGGSLQWSRAFHGLFRDALFGADVRSIAGEDRGRLFDPSGRLVLNQNGKGQQTSAGLFAQTSLSPAG